MVSGWPYGGWTWLATPIQPGMQIALVDSERGTLDALEVEAGMVYGLIGLMPGDPIDIMLSGNPEMTPEDAARLKADLVAFSPITPGINRAYELADELRSRGITCVSGAVTAGVTAAAGVASSTRGTLSVSPAVRMANRPLARARSARSRRVNATQHRHRWCDHSTSIAR